MSKYQRAKLWAKENQDILIILGLGASFVGVMVLAVKFDLEYQDRMNAELNAHIDELNALYHAGVS